MFKADHAALAVSNLARSREFYEYLGGRVVSRPSAHFVEVMLGNLRLHLVKASAPRTPHSPTSTDDHATTVGIDHVCVSVDTIADLQTVRDRLNACALVSDFAPFVIEESPPLGDGMQHAEERPPQKTLYAKDPDGIGLEIRCYR